MTKEDFKEYVSKGVAASKDALNRAGKAVSKFGDESILKIEIQQFKSQIKKDKAALGEIACKAFIEDGADSLPADGEEVARLTDSIRKAQDEIAEREERLSAPKEQ